MPYDIVNGEFAHEYQSRQLEVVKKKRAQYTKLVLDCVTLHQSKFQVNQEVLVITPGDQ
jgi:hypothetical protein